MQPIVDTILDRIGDGHTDPYAPWRGDVYALRYARRALTDLRNRGLVARGKPYRLTEAGVQRWISKRNARRVATLRADVVALERVAGLFSRSGAER
jgi:hypothetical protein